MKIKFYATVLFVFLTACSTIDINERDVFDAHRTISPQEFETAGYSLNETFFKTEDGVEINSWILKNDQPKATILYLGGNGFLMVKSRPLIELYSRLPVNVVFIDYRGYGKSSGEPSVRGVQLDAEAAYEIALEISEESNSELIVHGHSMGSFLSAHIADTRQVSGYILESPVSEIDSWTKGLVPWLLRPFIRFNIDEAISSQDNLSRVKRISEPLLIIGGDSDEITPFSMAEDLYKKSVSTQKEIVRIAGGGHNDLPVSINYFESINAFIGSL